jgi:predicted  nucleic acid-binding Zn-ribbon protein
VGSELDTLFKLQQLDIELREKQCQVEAFEAALAARGKEIDACFARIEELTTTRKALVTERALAERKVDDAKATLKDRSQRMNRVRTERELRANEREVSDLHDQIVELEEALLVVMQRVEDVEHRLEELNAERKQLEEADHRQLSDEADRIEALRRDLVREQEARSSVADQLETRIRQRYEQVFKRRGGHAVVEVRSGSCAGCHMHIPPQTVIEIMTSGALRVCPSCQRILYAPRAQESA